MTREEALKELEIPGNFATYMIIDIIYDDFESRTCSSCRHYEEVYNEKGWRTHHVMQCSIIKEPFSGDFGCNKWEAKDD